MCPAKNKIINNSKYYVWGGFKEPGCRDTQDVPLDRLVELAEVDAHLHDLGALEIRGTTLNGNLDCKTTSLRQVLM